MRSFFSSQQSSSFAGNSLPLFLFTYGIFNPWFADWMKNVPMLGLFLNNSQWYNGIILNNFFICSLKTPCHKIIIMQNVYFFSRLYFFQIWLDHFVPMLILFIQQPRTYKWEMKPVLRMGVQGPLYQDNSNDMQQLQGTIIMRQILYRFLFWYVYFLVLKILGISCHTVEWKMKYLEHVHFSL